MLYFGLSMGLLLALHEVSFSSHETRCLVTLTPSARSQANPEALQSKLVRSALRRVGGPSLAEVQAEQEKERRKEASL
jgi:hypothetical protein